MVAATPNWQQPGMPDPFDDKPFTFSVEGRGDDLIRAFSHSPNIRGEWTYKHYFSTTWKECFERGVCPGELHLMGGGKQFTSFHFANQSEMIYARMLA